MNDPTPFNPSVFALSGIFLAVTSAVLLTILFVYGKTKLHKLWIFFNLSVLWWGVGTYFIGRCEYADQALVVWKISYIGVIFIPVFFYHFSCSLAEIKRKSLIVFAYSQGILFSCLSIFDLGVNYVSLVEKVGPSFYYLKSESFVYSFSFGIWLLLVALGFTETLLKYFKEINPHRRNQFIYLMVSCFIGFTGGLSNFLLVFGSFIFLSFFITQSTY